MFIVYHITTDAAGKVTKAAYDKDTLNAALAEFHTRQGNAMKNKSVATSLAMVIDMDGAVYRSEKYTAEPTAE